MSQEHSFVPEVQIDCLLDLVRIIKNGEIFSRKYEAIQHGAWFIGCAAAKLGSDPSVYTMAIDTQPELEADLPELASEVEKLALAAGSDEDEDKADLDPLTVITIIGIVIRIIAALRK